MTPKQSTLLRFIGAYRAEHGYGPSLQECATYMGMKSRACAHRMVALLVRDGELTHDAGEPRSIRLSGQ